MTPGLLAQVDALMKAGDVPRPPVHLWHPHFCGDIDIRIARDGTWYHEGAAFERSELVRLFASILRREGDEYFLVTPVEKWRIRIEDAPFVATDCEVLGAGRDGQLVFVTNIGERVHAGSAHPLRIAIDPSSGEPAPYLAVRDGLEARISRSVYYRLVDIAEERNEGDETVVGVWSDGVLFEIGRF